MDDIVEFVLLMSVAALCLISGCYVGDENARTDVRTEAIESGVGEYYIDESYEERVLLNTSKTTWL